MYYKDLTSPHLYQNELFHVSSLFQGIRLWIVKKFGVAITFHWGQYGLPLLPLKTKLTLVMGKPLKVEKVEETKEKKITDEQAQIVLDEYIKRFTEMFENSKQYNPSSVPAVLDMVEEVHNKRMKKHD